MASILELADRLVVFGHFRKVQWSSCAGQLGCPVVNNTQLLLVHLGMFTHGEDLKKEGRYWADSNLQERYRMLMF